LDPVTGHRSPSLLLAPSWEWTSFRGTRRIS
jgi:hypothetical protein